MKVPDLYVGKRLFVGEGNPIALGLGPAEARGSAYIEGPAIIGEPLSFPFNYATLMVGPNRNKEAIPPVVPGALCTGVNNPYSLAIDGDAAIFNTLDVALNINAGLNIVAQGEVMSRCGGHILSAKKNFDIPHPSKEGWRLTHTCVEGPEASVYIRGRITNKKEITLPSYWKDLVVIESITVNLTPIGAHQDIVVKRWDDEKVYLQSKGGMPIDCFYYIMGERKDTEKLIPEYRGTIEDYPGDNSQRSIAGYHYDIKK